MDKNELKALRQAVADYMASEGCSCCRGGDHTNNSNRLGALLKVPRYSDDSGYDFAKFRSKK